VDWVAVRQVQAEDELAKTLAVRVSWVGLVKERVEAVSELVVSEGKKGLSKERVRVKQKLSHQVLYSDAEAQDAASAGRSIVVARVYAPDALRTETCSSEE
jgi:hypothetical protein